METRYPDTHVVITPSSTDMPEARYTKKDRRKAVVELMLNILAYIVFVLTLLSICVIVSILLQDTKWFFAWLFVCLLLGWLASELKELFF